MGDFDPAAYFEEHPERWLSAVVAASLGAVVFAVRTAKARGFLRRMWNLAMLLVQIAVVAGLVKAREPQR